MDGPYSRGASDEADCSSTNWDLHTGKETIYQAPIYELNTNFRVYGLKQKCMYLEALKLVSIFQQGKLAALWIFSLYFQFIVRGLSDLQSSLRLRKVNLCTRAASYLTVIRILPQLQPAQILWSGLAQ